METDIATLDQMTTPEADVEFPVTKEQSDTLDTIIAQTINSPTELQRLALEASKILTATEKRLDACKNLGFFKRIWFVISGKRAAMERITQRDLITVQKMAWYFLMKLQEQNLLQARAIAVIRNNLKDVASELSEIHGLIGELVEKLGGRLKNLADSIEQVKWLVYLDGRRSEFADSEKFPVVCALQLVYDYINMLREKCMLTNAYKLDIEGTMRVALSKFGIADKFGLDTKNYTVEDFIVTLFDEEMSGGLRAKIENAIVLKDGKGDYINPESLRSFVNGTGFNALYEYDDDMRSFKKLNLKGELSQTVRDVIRKNLNSDDVKYSLIELASEIIGGYLLAIELTGGEPSVADAPISVLPAKLPDGDAENGTEPVFNSLRKIAGLPGVLNDGATFHIDKDRIVEQLGNMCFAEYLPDGVRVTQKNGEWELPPKGCVEYIKGTQDINTEKAGNDNPAALSLDFEKVTGKFNGKFKVYRRNGNKIDVVGFEVIGVMVNGVGYGMAFSEGNGAFAVTVE